MTASLYNVIRSELIKKGLNEFVDAEGNLLFFQEESQFLTKILNYDEDVSAIVNHLFAGQTLPVPAHDKLFKKTFLTRFAFRNINRQTVEAFKMELLSTFLTHQRYIGSVYADLDKFILQQQNSEQVNNQSNQVTGDSESLTDNRSAFANLPQNNVQLDVNSTIMTTASDNTISRNKQTGANSSLTESDGTTSSDSSAYKLEELLKSNGMEKQIFDEFDRKCFMQIW